MIAELTPRELDTLRLAARGLEAYEIGLEVGTSENTVRTQLRKVRRKLGAANTAHAVALAAAGGLLPGAIGLPEGVTADKLLARPYLYAGTLAVGP